MITRQEFLGRCAAAAQAQAQRLYMLAEKERELRALCALTEFKIEDSPEGRIVRGRQGDLIMQGSREDVILTLVGDPPGVPSTAE